MRKALVPIFLLAITFSFAQRPQRSGQRPNPIRITGTVLDKDSKEPLEYATLVLQSVRNPETGNGRHY